MHIKSLLDFKSQEWETLYAAISELIPSKDARSDEFDNGHDLLRHFEGVATEFDIEKLTHYASQFPKDGSVYHIAFDHAFLFGGWYPLESMTTFCGVYTSFAGTVYYFGDGHVASTIMEIENSNWIVVDHHYPVAPVDTYYQLAAFLLFFTGQNEQLNEQLQALFPFTEFAGVELGDPQPMTSDLIDVAAVAEMAQWKTISAGLNETNVEDAAVPALTNIERLEARTAELLEEQEVPQVPKTVLYDYNDPLRKLTLKGAAVIALATVGYGLYRFFRG